MNEHVITNNGYFYTGVNLRNDQLGKAIKFFDDGGENNFCEICKSPLWIDALGMFCLEHGRVKFKAQ